MKSNQTIDIHDVVKDHNEAIYRICKAYMGVSADLDDVHQEVLINVWKALGSFRGDARLSTWIYRITVNTVITHRRKQAKKTNYETSLSNLTYLSEDTADREKKLEDEERHHQLQRAIAQLKPDQRIVIGLFLEDLSYKDIADVIGKDTNYVGVKLKRIKHKLSKMMS